MLRGRFSKRVELESFYRYPIPCNQIPFDCLSLRCDSCARETKSKCQLEITERDIAKSTLWAGN
jgi:hypothetical protein